MTSSVRGSSVQGSSAQGRWIAQIEEDLLASMQAERTVSIRPQDPARPGATTIRAVLADGQADDAWGLFTASLGQLRSDGDVLLVGLGPAPAQDPEAWRRAGEQAGALLRGPRVRVEVPAADPEQVTAWFAGITCAAPRGERVELLVAEELREAAQTGAAIGDAVRLARSLSNAPSNVATPQQITQWALLIAEQAGVHVSVLEEDGLREQGWGCLLAVAAGSALPPRVVTLRHGSGARPDISFVGKGVTFDSGGLSLKSPASMQAMRNDKTGAATALAAFAALVRLRSPLTIEAVLPLAENMPGSHATRPGDVVTALNGTQVQVMDTDFEGRLLLADALIHAGRSQPRLVVDIATLTYQAVVALGADIGAMFSNDDWAAGRLAQAAQAAGEPVWQLPLAQRYLPQVRIEHGLRNHPMNDSGRAITAALFLQQFVDDDTPWVHLDVAGPTWRGDASGDGATGYLVASLIGLGLSAVPRAPSLS